MSDPFETLYGPEPEPADQQPKKVGLVVGTPLTQAEFEAKFVNRKFGPADYHVDFEVQNEKGEWIDADEAGK